MVLKVSAAILQRGHLFLKHGIERKIGVLVTFLTTSTYTDRSVGMFNSEPRTD